MFKKSPTPNNWHTYVEERLSAYIDGRLSDEERADVRRHLQECELCQSSLDSLGWTIKLLKQVPAPPLPRQFTLPVPEPTRAPATAGWLKWGFATASVLATAAFVILLTVDLLAPHRATSIALAPAAAPLTAAPFQPTQPAAMDRTLKVTSAPGQPTPGFAPSHIESQPNVAPLPAATQAPAERSAQATAGPRSIQPTPTRELSIAKQVPATSSTIECQGCSGAGEATAQAPRITSGIAGGPYDSTSEAPAAPPGLGGGGAEPTATPQSEKPTTALPAIAAASVITGSVSTATPLWVLAGPSNSSDKIGVLASGTTVQILGRDTDGFWLQIVYPLGNDSNERGWIAEKFVNLSVPLNNLPIVEPTPGTPTPGAQSLAPPQVHAKAIQTERAARRLAGVLGETPPAATAASPPVAMSNAAAKHTSTRPLTVTPSRTQTRSPRETQMPPVRIQSPMPRLTIQLFSNVQDDYNPLLRIAEIATLVTALVLGVLARFVIRG